MRELITPFATSRSIPFVKQDVGVRIDTYLFNDRLFAQLIAYVDRGGYPRWQDEQRPDSGVEMMKELKKPLQVVPE